MFYSFVKLFFALLVKIYLRLKVRGRGNVPATGAAIVVANHASFLDPIVLGSACPRKIHFIVLREMYDWWRLRWFYWGMETIPVRREEEARAIKLALGCLKRGQVVGIFPEGGRSSDGILKDAKQGAALMAALSGAPVVPACIRGAFESLPIGGKFPSPAPVSVRFGEPLRFVATERGRRDRAAIETFSRELVAAIAALEEPALENQPDRDRQRAASSGSSGNS
ncbi:MAG TPA: lysophospholipid acyltransferase family protein [Candidatus Polarisedimenticolia bacterium]|nr:lysophospholipid acyltransferase family protein [Candidatus Polarisedimenticolia bacterium]